MTKQPEKPDGYQMAANLVAHVLRLEKALAIYVLARSAADHSAAGKSQEEAAAIARTQLMKLWRRAGIKSNPPVGLDVSSSGRKGITAEEWIEKYK